MNKLGQGGREAMGEEGKGEGERKLERIGNNHNNGNINGNNDNNDNHNGDFFCGQIGGGGDHITSLAVYRVPY